MNREESKTEESKTIASAILRELNKSESKVVDLDEVPEFSRYKKSLPMHKYGWLRNWDQDFAEQLMKEARDKNICFETGKVMGKKEARGFAWVRDDEIYRIFVIATKC